MTNVDTIRVEIAVRFDGVAWGTVPVDISRREGHRMEVELVPAFEIESDFGIPGPDRLPCITSRYHLAHKLHGMTKTPGDGAPNERVQDAIDALMFMPMVDDLTRVREACLDVFTARQQHAWPPVFSPPKAWAQRFERMAAELELEVRDLDSAVTVLQGFIREIHNAGGADHDVVSSEDL
jgi:Nucleotidyl transferase AbiEii toxin, Type IV TA system